MLNAVMGGLLSILENIPAPDDLLYCQVCPNSGHDSESISAIPDLSIKLWSEGDEDPCRLPRTIWLMESAFSQSDADVMDKL